MSVLALTLLPVSIAVIFLSIVIINAKRTKSMFVFILLLLSFICWSVTNYFSLISESNEDIFYWMQIVMFVTTYLFLFVIEFSNLFPDEEGYMSNYVLGLFRIGAILVSIMALNGLIISDATINSGQITPVFGPSIPLYGIFTLAAVSGSGFILYKKAKQGNEFSRRKIRYMAVGLITTTVLGVTTNLIFVLLGQTNFVALGPTFLLILLTSIFVLVISGEIFDLRLVFGQLTYFTLMTLYSAVFFVVMLLINSNLFENVFSPEAIILSFITTIVFVYSYNLLNRFINNKVSISIINAGYDQNKVIADLTNELGQILDYRRVIEIVLKKVTSLLSIDSSYVWVDYNNINDDIFINLNEENIDTKIPKAIKNKLATLLSEKSLLNESGVFIDFVLNDTKTSSHQAVQIANTVRDTGVKVLFPINKSEEVVGLVFIGEKQNSVPLTDNEKSFLSRILKLLNTSLVRSLLYEDVSEFNVTLQKKVDEATAELQNTNTQLSEALRKEKDMMDILGHELRTPLGTARNAILMLDTMRKNNNMEQEKLDKYMKIAVNNIRREKDMLEVILQSARLENSRLQINMTKIPIDDVLESTFTSFQGQAEKKNLELKVENNTQDQFVKADQTGIQQVVDNFTSNSVKYTESGSVTIFTEKIDETHLRIGVKDTGEGISEKDLPHIGKKFYRANPYLQSAGKIGDEEIVRPGGTGIGMYVVKGLLEAMGTKLEIQSEVGKGSIFSAVFEVVDPNSTEISSQEQEKPLG